MFDFEWTVELGRHSVVWAERGDEWIQRFGACLDDAEAPVERTGMRWGAQTPFVHIRLCRRDGEPSSQVLVGVLEGGIVVLTAGNGPRRVGELDALRVAAECATARLGEERDEFEWSAIVGLPRNRSAIIDRFRLSESAEVGPLRLESPDQVMVEVLPGSPPSFGSAAMSASVPIRVRGTSRGYSWEDAAVRSAADLHRLCGLLSLAWRTCFVVRDAPAPLDWGLREVPPAPLFDDVGDIAERGDDGPDLTEFRERDVPDWVDAAWARIDEQPAFGDALSALHEGLRAQFEHPSLALVAFVAAVETVGTVVLDRSLGSSARFREALRLVVDGDEADRLGGAYVPRSRTVHAGRLYGGERSVGAVDLRPWPVSEKFDFRWGLLDGMERAARELVLRALRDDLPEREFARGDS